MIFAGWTWASASKSMPDPWYITNTIGRDTYDWTVYDTNKAFPDEDIVLKAHWALPRTITLHGNGGTGTFYGVYPPTTTSDASFQLPDIRI